MPLVLATRSPPEASYTRLAKEPGRRYTEEEQVGSSFAPQRSGEWPALARSETLNSRARYPSSSTNSAERVSTSTERVVKYTADLGVVEASYLCIRSSIVLWCVKCAEGGQWAGSGQ